MDTLCLHESQGISVRPPMQPLFEGFRGADKTGLVENAATLIYKS